MVGRSVSHPSGERPCRTHRPKLRRAESTPDGSIRLAHRGDGLPRTPAHTPPADAGTCALTRHGGQTAAAGKALRCEYKPALHRRHVTTANAPHARTRTMAGKAPDRERPRRRAGRHTQQMSTSERRAVERPRRATPCAGRAPPARQAGGTAGKALSPQKPRSLRTPPPPTTAGENHPARPDGLSPAANTFDYPASTYKPPAAQRER